MGCVCYGNFIHAIFGLSVGHELNGLQQVLCVPYNHGRTEVEDAPKALQVVLKVSIETWKRLDIDTEKRARVTADYSDKLLFGKVYGDTSKEGSYEGKSSADLLTLLKKKAATSKKDWLDFLRQLHFSCFEKHKRKSSGKLTEGYCRMDTNQEMKLNLQKSMVEHKGGLQDLTIIVNETGQCIPFCNM